MPKPGPKPKDQRLRDLDGNPEKKPRRPDPVKASGAPTPPDWLGEYSLKIWNSILGSMPPNFYSEADAILLASYCQACTMAKKAVIQIEAEDITLKNVQGNMIRNPACAVLSDAMSKIVTIGNHLGLDPSARQSMGIHAGSRTPDEDKPDSEFGDLIALQGGKR